MFLLGSTNAFRVLNWDANIFITWSLLHLEPPSKRRREVRPKNDQWRTMKYKELEDNDGGRNDWKQEKKKSVRITRILTCPAPQRTGGVGRVVGIHQTCILWWSVPWVLTYAPKEEPQLSGVSRRAMKSMQGSVPSPRPVYPALFAPETLAQGFFLLLLSLGF